MLVLSRKLLEGIVIGNDIRITVVKVERNHVRIGIEAPGDVVVVREELLHDAEHREARAAWDSSERGEIHESTPSSLPETS
jgi:carbon storage regulator